MRTLIALLLTGSVAGGLAGCRSCEPDGGSASRPAPPPRGSGESHPPIAPPGPAVASTPTVLATLAEDETLAALPTPAGLGMHAPRGDSKREIIFGDRGGGVAYVAEKGDEVRVVHNGRPGDAYAAVGEVALSLDGRRCAYGALRGGKWRMVVDGKEGAPFDTVKMPVFSPDGAHLAYQAMSGDLWHIVVDAAVNGGTRTRYLGHEFAGDSSRLAFIADVDDAETGRLAVTDLAFRRETTVDTRASRLVVSADRSTLAAIAASDGQQRAVVARFDHPEQVRRGPKQEAIRRLVLAPDGGSLAYVAERAGERIVTRDDREEPAPDEPLGPPVFLPGKGLGALVVSGAGVHLQQFFRDAGQRGADYEEAEGLAYADDGRSHAYAARRGEQWFAVLNGKEGPPFDRVVTPAFSPDGKWLAYRARKDGRRFVVVQATAGGTTKMHPAYEQVFPVLFTPDGKAAAYGVKDGRALAWKVEPL